MIWITKLGERIKILRIGVPEHEGPTNEIKGINLDSNERDLFGKRVVDEYTISDFMAFEGSYVFPIDNNINNI